MSEKTIKLCDQCKTNHPAKHFIQWHDHFQIVCADCHEELNSIPEMLINKEVADMSKKGSGDGEFVAW